MKMKIYDYANKVKEVEVPDDKQIKYINVRIYSGDETGFINFTDGSNIIFDASDSRCISFNDGCYIVEGDDIAAWLKWKPCGNGLTYSYMRQMAFSGL